MEIEQKAVLLGLQKPEKFVDDLMLELSDNHFSDYYAGRIYDWISKRYSKGQRISLTSCINELDLSQKLFDQYLLESEFDSYIEDIKKEHQRRKIKQAISELQEMVDCNWTTEEYRTKAQEIIFEHTDKEDGRDKLIEMNEALEEAFENLVRKDEEKIGQGLQTGYPGIDCRIGGLEPGHLTVIAGQTSMGKTAFALNVTHNIIRQNKTVLFFSLEMSAKEIADRMIIRESRVDASKYQKRLDEPAWKNVNAALSRLTDKPLLIAKKEESRLLILEPEP